MAGPEDSGLEVGDSGGRVRYSGEGMKDSRGEDYPSIGTFSPLLLVFVNNFETSFVF